MSDASRRIIREWEMKHSPPPVNGAFDMSKLPLSIEQQMLAELKRNNELLTMISDQLFQQTKRLDHLVQQTPTLFPGKKNKGR